ncbi:hypothetical protein DFQ27_001084, partial [Actinomortierella ambigua]
GCQQLEPIINHGPYGCEPDAAAKIACRPRQWETCWQLCMIMATGASICELYFRETGGVDMYLHQTLRLSHVGWRVTLRNICFSFASQFSIHIHLVDFNNCRDNDRDTGSTSDGDHDDDHRYDRGVKSLTLHPLATPDNA